jgi:hypothetical protein
MKESLRGAEGVSKNAHECYELGKAGAWVTLNSFEIKLRPFVVVQTDLGNQGED